jgi:hypothetical protein
VLEGVVEQVEARPPSLFGFESGGVAAFADDDIHAQAARHQQWFVAEVLRQAGGIDDVNTFRSSTVAATENVERNAALLEHFTEHDDERRLARTAHADVADGNYRAAEFVDGELAAIVELVPKVDARTEESGGDAVEDHERLTLRPARGAWCRNPESVSMVRVVAPQLARTTSAAWRPRSSRFSGWSRR